MNLREYSERMANRIARYEDEMRQVTQDYVTDTANLAAEFMGDEETVSVPIDKAEKKDPFLSDDDWRSIQPD